jgi:quercetin dioxygenase-like cupin family protein
MSQALQDDDFHIPPEASRDPEDRAFIKQWPENYDAPGPRWFEEMGTPLIDGSRAGTSQGRLSHQMSVVGPDLELSTHVFEYAPELHISNHFHDVDQIQFITDGEAWLGNRRLRPGEGLLTPAGNAYAFRAGPKGVRMFEFRRRAPFRYGFAADGDEIQGWVRKREHKSQFFDLETTPPEPVGKVGTGTDTFAFPGTVQVLMPPSGNDVMSLYAVTLVPGARIPTHAEDAQRQLIGHAGEIEISGRGLRRGDGVRWPADELLELVAGPAGATYLVHRARPQWTKSTDGRAWPVAGGQPGLPF